MKRHFLLFLFLLVGIPLMAQTDSLNKDSLKIQDEALLLIKRTDSIVKADSLSKLILIKELEELTKFETKKRARLEAKLRELDVQDSLRKAKMKSEVDSLKTIAKAFPVAPHSDTLFHIFTKIGNLTVDERYNLVMERLGYLYKHFIVKYDSLGVIDYGQTVDLVFKDKTILSISEYDEMWFNKSKLAIAEEYKGLILKDIVVYKDDKSFFKVLKQIGLIVLIIVLQVFLIKGINLLFRKKIDSYIKKQRGKRLKGIKLKEYQFLDDERLTDVVLFISKIVRWFFNLVQLYITIPIIFSIFPPTQRLAETLFGYILTPLKKIGHAVLNYLPDLFAIIVIVVITRYVIKFLRFLASEIYSGNLKLQGFYQDWAFPTFNIIRFLVLAFMFVMIFPYLPGSDSPVFQGVSVFIGIVFSLGSSSVIGNMVAGLVMTYMRPFKIGDRIKLNDLVGDVVEKTPFVTRIKTPKKEYVTIPNSTILSSSVVNYSTSKENEGIVLHTTVTIGYDVPWRKVHEVLIEAAKKTKYIITNPAPFVLQTSLDDFYVSYQLNAYSYEPNQQPVTYSELHQNIQDAFNEHGIEILSPHYRAQRDGNETTIPKGYLPDDYEAPSFRVKGT